MHFLSLAAQIHRQNFETSDQIFLAVLLHAHAKRAIGITMINEKTRLLSGQSVAYSTTRTNVPQPVPLSDAARPGISSRQTLKTTSHFLFWIQTMLIVMISTFAREQFLEDDKFLNAFQLFTGVEVMVLIGFGYLRTFLKRYSMNALVFTLFVTAVGLQWGILTEGFFSQTYAQSYGYIPVNLLTVLAALDQVTTLLISFGAVIGRISPLQLLVMVVLECVFYSINKCILLVGWLDFIDAGGSIQIHMFGAYFGLAVAYMLGTSRINNTGSPPPSTFRTTQPTTRDRTQIPHEEIMSMLGTLFLFIYWPSFNGRALQANSHAQQRAVVGTIFALCSSTVGALFASSFCNNKSRKFRTIEVQNAVLSGGVAIGSVCNMVLSLGDCLLLGFVGGVVSTVGCSRIQPLLAKRGMYDACGVHNLHALPALVGGLASVILCYTKAHQHPGTLIFAHTNQAMRQFLSICITIALSIVSGVGTGLLLRCIAPHSAKDLYVDSVCWESDALDEQEDDERMINYASDLGALGDT